MSRKFSAVAAFMIFSAPAIANARYALSDLLKPGTHQAEQMTLALDPALKPLFDKFGAALKDPAIMKDMAAKLKPGQPMPYDSRFGFSEADYKKLQAGLDKMMLVPTGQKTTLVIEHTGDMISVKSDGCTLLKAGAKVDKSTSMLSIPGREVMKGTYFENRVTPVAPLDGYSWRHLTESPFLKVGFTVGRRINENFCLIDCDLASPGVRDTNMIRYDCVSVAGATATTTAAIAPAAASTVTAASAVSDNPLAELDRIAKTDTSAMNPPPAPVPVPEKKKLVTLPVVQESVPPPAHDPSKVKVPVRATGKSPSSVCRAALSRYPIVSPSMYQRCKDANEFSSHAVNVYTYIYKGGMADSLLAALLRINNSEKEECAIQIAKQYAGTMTTKYLEDTCL